MIHKTLQSAMAEPGPSASWKQKVIIRVSLAKTGTTFYRTYVFDQYDQCKKCRKALNNGNRQACMGHYTEPCDICGNPFNRFTRKARRKNVNTGQFETINYWEGGKLH